jgi:colicin import membrane protein
MGSNVDKIVGDIVEKLKPLVRDAVQQADTAARSELLGQLTKAIGSNGKAATAAAPVKRKPGRPRKNPVPETAAAAPAKKTKAKQKRVLSPEVKAKLAENLAKARKAKADKVKPAKRKPGRPKKTAEAPAATEAA